MHRVIIVRKLRAWFSGRTRPCQGRDSGSIPGARTKIKYKIGDKSVDIGYKRQEIWLKYVKMSDFESFLLC